MRNNPNKGQQVGEAGEELIRELIDIKLSQILTFPRPRTSQGAEVSDILIWMNRLAILVEVKTRAEGTTRIENWARNRIQEGVEQIVESYERIQRNETINLHNDYYHASLDCASIADVIGIIILVHEEEFNLKPSSMQREIYRKPVPIHVFSWNDLREMTKEIDTLSDLRFYLHDRYQYVQSYDIHVGAEIEAIGFYKSHNYKFPSDEVDFLSTSYWDEYQTKFASAIEARDSENQASGWIDNLEQLFTKPRRLYDGLPMGLYFAWEVASLPRRYRTIIGQKMESVQDWFDEGNSSRKFAYFNKGTGNWLVFYYLRGNTRQVQRELERLVRLKLVLEVHNHEFKHAVYGFGFSVSLIDPPRLLGMPAAEVSADPKVIEGDFTQDEVDEAGQNWGRREEIKLREFPDQ